MCTVTTKLEVVNEYLCVLTCFALRQWLVFYLVLVFVDPQPLWLLKSGQCFGINQDDGNHREHVRTRFAVQKIRKNSLKSFLESQI